MNKSIFNKIGWLLLLGIGVSWLWVGYSSWYLLLLPLAYLSFSIYTGSVKKVSEVKHLSIQQVTIIILAFVLSVAIVFILIYSANYLINDKLQLIGGIKTFCEIIAIIIALYPVKFTFDTVVEKVTKDLKVAK